MSVDTTPPQPCGRSVPTHRFRRVCVANEASDRIVAGVIPDEQQRPTGQRHWRDHLHATIGASQYRRDRRATLMAVGNALMRHADWSTHTSRPTHAVLIECCQQDTGHGSPHTITRAIATLIEVGVIARVAAGRRGCFAPGGCRARMKPVKAAGTPCLNPEECPGNEAAVYVLVVPKPRPRPQERRRPDRCAVDRNGTPPPRSVSEAHPVRAHARFKTHNEPLRGTHHHGPAQAPATGQLIPHRNDPLWPGWATTSSQSARFFAACEMQRRLPALRQISTRDLRSCLRVFLLAGWTVNDLCQALDRKPDGSRWPHDGARGIGPYGVRGWIAHRLTPWLDPDGQPLHSPSQAAAARRAQDDELRRETARRDAELRAADPPIPAPATGPYAAAKRHLQHVNRGAGHQDGCPVCDSGAPG